MAEKLSPPRYLSDDQHERDEKDRGLGDLPYPPDFPKMPGEPKRVQPSKARAEAPEEGN